MVGDLLATDEESEARKRACDVIGDGERDDDAEFIGNALGGVSTVAVLWIACNDASFDSKDFEEIAPAVVENVEIDAAESRFGIGRRQRHDVARRWAVDDDLHEPRIVEDFFRFFEYGSQARCRENGAIELDIGIARRSHDDADAVAEALGENGGHEKHLSRWHVDKRERKDECHRYRRDKYADFMRSQRRFFALIAAIDQHCGVEYRIECGPKHGQYDDRIESNFGIGHGVATPNHGHETNAIPKRDEQRRQRPCIYRNAS